MTSVAEPTQLVVALPHLGMVLSALDEARERAETDPGRLHADTRTSDVLGLALITLPAPERAAAALERWASIGGDRSGPALDRILAAVRAGFGRDHHGWTPLLGKNRIVGEVHGRMRSGGAEPASGEVSHGGGGAPVAIARPAWAHRPGTAPSGVVVGLIDTAMVSHDYLTGAWTGPYPGAGDGRPVRAETGHATFIAGLVRRYAPAATLSVHPVLDGTADAWTTAHRIVEAGRAGVDVLNLSFVCYTDDGAGPLVLATALERLGRDTVVVAAAGNHGYLADGRDRQPAFPAAFPNVVAVGAEGAGFSAKGPWITAVAPGTGLESTYLSGPVSVWEDPDGPGPAPATRHDRTFRGYARWSGTSFAAAVVSAMIAHRTVPGRISAAEVAARLLTPTADGKPVVLDPATAP
ncbi:S8 family peptidase [Actinoplanes sp. CA-252034]|uniref:S8 family peptidase n=1 Tax=Actinoplanes sp. CA-252034 TaxID=3239906 RepID=UPI003D99AAC5